MTITESNLSYDAFCKLCDDLNKSELVCSEDYQYWLFELGYKAALQNKSHANE